MLVSTLIALAALLPGSQATSNGSLESRLDSAAKAGIDSGRMVGFSLAVIEDGKVALEKQYGLASIRRKTPVNADSEFAIGSVSKQFTAACILLLQEDGKLSLTDPVGKFFPDMTDSGTITIRDLLNHVSGYLDWYPLDYLDSRLAHDVPSEYVRHTYGTMPLDFQPGSFYSYSNTGYLIAAMIVEKASGKRFFDFLSQRILKPLRMDHTYEYRQTGPRFTERYTRFFQAPLEVAVKEAPGWCLGAGGLVSTPDDLAKWDIALMNGQVLKPNSWALMTQPRTLSGGGTSMYALGLVASHYKGHVIYVHSGGMAGSITENLICPDTRRGFAWTCNSDVADTSGFDKALMEDLVPSGEVRANPPPASSNLGTARAFQARRPFGRRCRQDALWTDSIGQAGPKHPLTRNE
jgi:CubicO group peptidase (beta-lactamase class C family)